MDYAEFVEDGSGEDLSDGMDTGTILGIVFGSVGGLLLIAATILLVRRKRKTGYQRIDSFLYL